MGKREETRRFWADVVSRYERAGQPRKVFAANHKVGLAALQYWICKLRREAEGARRPPAAASSELRLVPVRVARRRLPRLSTQAESRSALAAFRFACRWAATRATWPVSWQP